LLDRPVRRNVQIVVVEEERVTQRLRVHRQRRAEEAQETARNARLDVSIPRAPGTLRGLHRRQLGLLRRPFFPAEP